MSTAETSEATQTHEGELPIVARGVARPWDYTRACWMVFSAGMRWWAKMLGTLLILVFLGFTPFAVVIGEYVWAGVTSLVLVGLAYIFVLQGLRQGFKINRYFRKVQDPPTWEFSSGKIEFKRLHESATWTWGAFPSAIQSGKVVLIIVTSNHFHVFSRPMFDDDESWRRFRALVRRQLMGCERCGYTLKGSVADTCPECGQPIT